MVYIDSQMAFNLCALSIVGAIVAVIAAAVWFYRAVFEKNEKKRLPPGPLLNRTPFVGYLPYMGDMPHIHLCSLAKEYGDVFTLRFGSYDIVVLNTLPLIKSCFKESVYSGRPNYLLAMEVSKHGITFATGQEGFEQRRFVLKTLRDMGFGKRTMENLIVEEVKELVQYFRSFEDGSTHKLTYLFGLSVINALWSILASRKFSITDEYAKRCYQVCIEGFIDPPVSGPLWFLPWIAKMFPQASGYKSVVTACEELKCMINTVVQSQRVQFENTRKVNNFVDAYLARIDEEKDVTSSFYGDAGYNNLVHVLIDLFTAGSDTLNSSLNFAIKFLCENRKLQEDIHKELDNLLSRRGKSESGISLVVLDDRAELPLLDAVITETLRISTIVTNAILHSTTEDVELKANGTTFLLPKDTIVMPNLYWIHHNPKDWEDPDTFNPYRFLRDGERDEAKKNQVIPFCTGKRVCIAEYIAQVEFFLFLGGLLANFEFEGAKVDKDGKVGGIKCGLVLNVDGLEVKIRRRKNMIVGSFTFRIGNGGYK